jgi:hypothetical protein
MADSKKKTVTRGNGTWVLEDGSLVPFFEGDEVPDGLAKGQLEHKQKAGVFDGAAEIDWQTLASVGTVPMDPEAREEAALQMVTDQPPTTVADQTPTP